MKLLLFDVDGTLTPPRLKIENEMLEKLKSLNLLDDVHLGFVGGSDIEKQIEQLDKNNFNLFKWRFSENGLFSFKDDECFHVKKIIDYLGEKNYKKLINICLFVLSNLDCPVKRGTFIEYRNGMINISPIGRSCNQQERVEFNNYDQDNNVRKIMINQIKKLWNEYLNENNLNDSIKLKFSIGGQISADIFPEGWDKTYCLQFLKNQYDEIHFFGDKTHQGGNDYEIYEDSRVIGHKVEKYQDTIEILNKLF